MRVTVLILGILGGLIAAFLGMKWLGDYNAASEQIALAETLGVDTSALGGMRNAAYFLISGLVTGIVGGILAFKGNGRLAAPLMLLSVLGAAVFAPKSLAFSFLLVLAAALALRVKSPAGAPRQVAQTA